jgi:predicted nucleic acid-binding protein
LFVDTSVWSHAFRRDTPSNLPEVATLEQALIEGGNTVTTGLVLQELLQGLTGARAKSEIVERFGAFQMIVPTRDDHVEAAELRNRCRRAGIQIGTVDALIARLCIAYDFLLLTTDRDFTFIARHSPLRVWKGQ